MAPNQHRTARQLGPVEAFQEGLVKGIVTDSVQSGEDLNGAYVELVSVSDKNGYSARLRIDVRKRRGVGQDRKPVTVKIGNDLFEKSNENSDYSDGWVVQNISTEPGDEFALFQNGTYLELHDVVDDVAATAVKRAQHESTRSFGFRASCTMWSAKARKTPTWSYE